MKSIISESAKLSSTDALPYEPFLLREGYDKMDTEFELTFTEGGNRYRYGFSYNRSAIHKEWLCRKVVGRETSLFERDGDTIETSNGFQGNGRLIDTAIEATKDNSLFLSVCDMFNIESAKKVMDWQNNLIVIDAQLIFATHDTNLLTYAKLRRDQIYFVEKNDWESSELFSLSDFKYIGEKDGVAFSESERPDTDKEKRYIEAGMGLFPHWVHLVTT